MVSLEYLNIQLNQYNALRNKINGVRNELMKAYQSLDVATTIGLYYSVDNVSADGNSIEKQRSNIFTIYNNLERAISSVNNTITTIKKQISEEESRLELEQQTKNDSVNETQNKYKKTGFGKSFDFKLR